MMLHRGSVNSSGCSIFWPSAGPLPLVSLPRNAPEKMGQALCICSRGTITIDNKKYYFIQKLDEGWVVWWSLFLSLFSVRLLHSCYSSILSQALFLLLPFVSVCVCACVCVSVCVYVCVFGLSYTYAHAPSLHWHHSFSLSVAVSNAGINLLQSTGGSWQLLATVKFF